MNTEWKLVTALRDSLLWTASSLAAIGKEQDVITLEGRKRTVGEILDEANEALNVPDDAAPTSHPIPTGATGEDEPVAKVRRGHYGGRVGNIGFQQVVLLPGVRVMDNTLLYARPAPAAGDALDAKPDWVACESRRPWVTNSLKASAQKLRDKESRCRTAYTKDFYGIPARYVADAYAEAAAVFESKLAAIAQQSQRKEA